MYCSPRLAMYGLTLRGPASRLPGSAASCSSISTGPRGNSRSVVVVATGGGGARRGATVARAGAACGTGRFAAADLDASIRPAPAPAGREAGRGASGAERVRRVEAGALRACVRCAAGLRRPARAAAGRAAFRVLDAGFLLAIVRSWEEDFPRLGHFRARDYTGGGRGVQRFHQDEPGAYFAGNRRGKRLGKNEA